MFLLDKIKKLGTTGSNTAKTGSGVHFLWYPSSRQAEPNQDSSHPVKIPPLMVRKTAWKK